MSVELRRLPGLLFLCAGTTALADGSGFPALQTVPLYALTAKSAVNKDKIDKNGFITRVSQPSFTVYPAVAGKETGVGIIICPGGGYRTLDYRAHVELVAPILNIAGITVFGLKCRLGPPFGKAPADALSDLKRAIRVIRSRAVEWKVNPDRIGVQGYSAGSHLALSLISANDSGDPGAAEALARTSARPDFAILMCPWPLGRNADNFHLPKDSPPIYIAQAEDDETAPAGFAKGLKHELDSLGVPVELQLVPRGGHLAFNFRLPGGAPAVPWTAPVIAWLKARGFLGVDK